MTWRCEICGQERDDNEISVLTYPLKDIAYAERNLKYCNMDDECYKKAVEKAKSGEM